MTRHALALAAALTLLSTSTPADEFALNPQVKKIVDEVSEDHIKAIIQHLVSFGTRNTMSNPDSPDHGVGAARQWILSEMKSYSPRLQVRFDKWHLKKNGQRIFKDIDIYDVVAVLPGKTMPETQVIVSGHYDSLNLGAQRPGGGAAGPGSEAPPAAIGEHVDAARAGVERVLDEFLDHARRPLDHLAGGDAVDDLFGKLADRHDCGTTRKSGVPI